MADQTDDRQAQIDALQATVARLEERLATLLQAPPQPPPGILDPQPPIQNRPPAPQAPPAPQNPPIINEDWYYDPPFPALAAPAAPIALATPIAPIVPVTSVLDQATQDKLAKIDLLECAIRKGKGFDDYALDLEGLFDEPKAKLPEKFKMPDIDKFDGTGNPKSHLHAVGNTYALWV